MSALVVLIAPPAAGKSTWAAKRFTWSQIVNLDALRTVVSDDPADQSATEDAVFLQHQILEKRCRRRLLTVADSTNVRAEIRQGLLAHAHRNLLFPVAVVFDTPLETCLAQNAMRDRQVPEHVIHRMWQQLTEEIPAEGPVHGFAQTLRIGPWGRLVHGRTPPAFDRAAWLS